MARQKNTKIDAKKLDEAIRACEGEKFHQGKISEIIMGHGIDYYGKMLKTNTISEDTLSRVCKYYGLTREDYLHVEPSPVAIVEPVPQNDPIAFTNIDAIVELLTSIDNSIKDLKEAYKATQFTLTEMQNAIVKSNANTKAVLDKLETRGTTKYGHSKYHTTVRNKTDVGGNL